MALIDSPVKRLSLECQKTTEMLNVQIAFNPLTPVPAMMSVGLCFTSDVITFDHNWHHLYSSSAGGEDLSNDTQIRVTGSIAPEICTKMLRNLTEKPGAKFSSTTPCYSVVRISRLDDVFREFLNWKQVQQKVNNCCKNIRKEKQKGEKMIIENEKIQKL